MSLAIALAIGTPFCTGPVGGVSYEPETLALVARFTTPPTTQRKGEINSLIAALKTAGVWVKLDILYLLAAADAQAAQRNWIADANNLTEVSAPTFTTDRGYTGNGTSSYLDTGHTPGSGHYALNDAHVSLWSLTAAQTATTVVANGSTVRASIVPRNASDLLSYRLNDTTSGTVANASGLGFFATNRAASGTKRAYKTGSLLGTNAIASTALPAASFRILGEGTNFSSYQAASMSAGSNLTDAENLAFYNALHTYMQAVGAAA